MKHNLIKLLRMLITELQNNNRKKKKRSTL